MLKLCLQGVAPLWSSWNLGRWGLAEGSESLGEGLKVLLPFPFLFAIQLWAVFPQTSLKLLVKQLVVVVVVAIVVIQIIH